MSGPGRRVRASKRPDLATGGYRIREHAAAAYLTMHQRAVLLREDDAADRRAADWWLAAAFVPSDTNGG